MLAIKEAAKIGIDACIDKIGRAFVIINRNNGTSGYGEYDESYVYCFVGVDDEPLNLSSSLGGLVLDSVSKFSYFANCVVNRIDGTVEFIDYISAV